MRPIRWSLTAALATTVILTSVPAAAQPSVAAVASHDGRLEIFHARAGAGGGVFHTWQPTKGVGNDAREWAPWVRYAPAPDRNEVVAARDAAGRVVAAWISDGSIWVAAADGAGASLQPPRRLDTNRLRSLVVASNQDGRLEFLTLNLDGQLWSVAQSRAGSWDSPNVHYLEGQNLQQIAATAYADGRLAVVALGGDWRVYWRAQNAPNSGWGPWSGLEGQDLQGVTTASSSDGRLEVVAVGGDGALYHRYQNVGGGWSPWGTLVDQVRAPVTLAANADGRLEVFARRSVVGSLAHYWQMAPNGGWTNTLATLGTLPDDYTVTTLEGRLTIVSANRAACTVEVIGQGQPNGGFITWLGGIPSPCPPPPPPAPKINSFAGKEYIPVGGSTTLTWSVANCGAGCQITLEGRNDPGWARVFLRATQLPAQGSHTLTPGSTNSKMTLTATSPSGTDTKSITIDLYATPTSPTCSGCSWFYFKMTPPSTLVSCVTVAYYAATESTAKQMAEAEWSGYKATTITYQQFTAGCSSPESQPGL